MTGDQNALPTVSIIIPTKNAGALLKDCLNHIQELDYPQDKIEVLIADGLSTDETVSIAKRFGAKVVPNPKQTVGPGRNVAFEVAKGELVAFTDADCLVDAGWIKNALAHFADATIGGVGGPTFVPPQQSSFAEAVRYLFRLAVFWAGSVHTEHQGKEKRVKHIPGCNMIFRRDVLAKVMPIDESLLTGEDLELSRCILQQGYSLLFAPDVWVWHHKRTTPKGFFRQMYRFAIGRLQVGKRARSWLHPMHLLCGVAIPLFLGTAVLIGFIKPALFFFAFGLILALSVLLSCWVLCLSRSVAVAVQAPLAVLLGVTAWSCGFLRELFFPMKEVIGK